MELLDGSASFSVALYHTLFFRVRLLNEARKPCTSLFQPSFYFPSNEVLWAVGGMPLLNVVRGEPGEVEVSLTPIALLAGRPEPTWPIASEVSCGRALHVLVLSIYLPPPPPSSSSRWS
jgi:hypothetical protein